MAKGLILCGQFVCWERIVKDSGVRYRCVVTDGSSAYTVSVKEPPEFEMGADVAVLDLRANAFRDRVYLTGERLVGAKL